jgi:glycosyltransferase involved in cell wall biosynthesis
MGARHNEHVLIAGNPEAFHRSISQLVTDAALRKKITSNARKLIEERYAWEQIGKEMNKVWKSLV